jgi:hypothetical protein
MVKTRRRQVSPAIQETPQQEQNREEVRPNGSIAGTMTTRRRTETVAQSDLRAELEEVKKLLSQLVSVERHGESQSFLRLLPEQSVASVTSVTQGEEAIPPLRHSTDDASPKATDVTEEDYGTRIRHRIEYPTFDGTESWEEFLARFKFTAKLHGHGRNLATRLCSTMRSAAMTYVCRLPVTTQENFEQLISKLATRYGNRTSVYEHFEKAVGNKWKADTGEELTAHVDAITKHAELAFAGVALAPEALERFILCAFVNTITDADVRAAVACLDPATALPEAVRIAEAVYQSKLFARNASNASRNVRQPTVTTAAAGGATVAGRPETSGGQKPRYANAKLTRTPQRPFHTPECWNCGKKGHISQYCRQTKTRRLVDDKDDKDESSEAASENEQ